MSDELQLAAHDAFSVIGDPKYNAVRLRLSLEIADTDNNTLLIRHDSEGLDDAQLGGNSRDNHEQRAYD